MAVYRIGVRHSNPEHLARCLRESEEGGPWSWSGMIWHPKPGYHAFAFLKRR